MTWMGTVSGGRFDYEAPDLAEIHISDIAHALSQICRFTGHTRRFYSVAQHSVLVSRIVPKEHALAGLLHDAHEAFVGDMATPLKDLLPSYRTIEERAWRAVATRLGVDSVPPDDVKRADLIALATERRDLLPRDGREWEILANVTPLFDRIAPMRPEAAEILFLTRYRAITMAARQGVLAGAAPPIRYPRVRRVLRALFVGPNDS